MTTPASWDLAPERWFTALCEKPPAGGRVWVNPPASAATPVARSSWSVSIWGSDRCRLVRATSTVSRKAITAIARAPGSRSNTSPNTGSTGVGRPVGTSSMMTSPRASMSVNATSAIPPATTTSGPGTSGVSRRSTRSRAMLPAETATVAGFASGICVKASATFAKKPPGVRVGRHSAAGSAAGWRLP